VGRISGAFVISNTLRFPTEASMRETTVLLAALLLPMGVLAGAPRAVNSAELAAIRAAVGERMKDPDSAKIRNVVAKRDGSSSWVFCGEVNAKNSYGGYVGFRKFLGMLLVRANTAPIAVLVGVDGGNETAVAQICASKGL
jgi:hypothetical protein